MRKYFILFLIVLSTISVFAQLSGTYSVGSTGDFTTLTSAIDALNTQGVSSAVVLELIDVEYSSATGENIPFTINEITGASATNTITLRPVAGVTASISGNSGGDYTALFKLKGTDYFVLDGSNNGTDSRDLTITNTKTSTWGATIWLASLGEEQGCHDNIIRNCKLKYNYNNGVSSVITFTNNTDNYVGEGYDNDDNLIENNEICKSHFGINLRGKSSDKNTGNIIRNNIIGSDVSNEYIESKGINCNSQINLDISSNEIFNIVNSSDAIGIFFNNCTSILVDKNNIHRIISTSLICDCHGVDIHTDATDPIITIRNNVIRDIASSGNSDEYSANPTGIYIDAYYMTTGIRLYHNTIFLNSNEQYGLNEYYSFSSALFIMDATGIDARNNIFANMLGKQTTLSSDPNCYAVYSNRSSNPFAVCDNNIYYANSPNCDNYIGYGSYNDLSTLAEWQSFTEDDENSFNIEPPFVSETNLDITESIDGVFLPDFDTDFHNDLRSDPPDIGADELNLPIVNITEIINLFGDNSAECTGEVIDDNGFAVTSRGFCWSTSQNPDLNDYYIESGSGTGEFSTTITGLTEDVYYIRAYATNEIGTGFGENKVVYPTIGEKGNALEFDGEDDFVEISDDNSLHLTTDVTFEVWIKSFTTSGNSRPITKGDLEFLFWDNEYENSSGKGYQIKLPGTSNPNWIEYDFDFNYDEWYHLCWSYSSFEGSLKMYVNGALDKEENITGSITTNLDNLILSGNYGNNLFYGCIDELRIWNIDRSAEEIRESIYTPIQGTESGLISYWQFNEGTGTEVVDQISGNDGTLNYMDDYDWIDSTIPFGNGISVTNSESIGDVGFPETDLAMFYNTAGVADITVSKINADANILPVATDEVFNDQYWVINRFGTDTFDADITFTINEDLSMDDENDPTRISLYARSSTADTSWVHLTNANSVNSSYNEATFEGITEFSQFIVCRWIQPLDEPQNVTITVSDLIYISWDVVTSATGYIVYSSTNPYTNFVEDITGIFYGESWSAPISDGKKFYYVKAMN